MSFSDLTYEEQYNAFFSPVCACLEKHKVEYVVHTANEEDYDYLRHNEYCCYIEIINPYRDDVEYGVRIEDEIILFHNNSHMHFDIYKDDNPAEVAKELVETIEEIIENRLAGYILLCGDGWLYGGSADLDRLAADTKNPFKSADESNTVPEFEFRLRSKGGRHTYTFWNPEFDREIEIPKREYTYFYYHCSKDGRHPEDRFVAINNSAAKNVVLIRSSGSRQEKLQTSFMTISHDAVEAVVALIRNNPCIMDFDDESLWMKDDLDAIRTNGIYNAFLFGDGNRENTIGEFGLWDYEDDAEGALKAAFEVFHKIKGILLDEGIPETCFEICDVEPLFEGYEIRNYQRLKPKHPALNTLGDLYQILTFCWKAETAYPSDQKDWTEDVPSYGQCAITAMLVYDLFGGEMYRTKDHSHYYNRIDGHWVDLTAAQFWAYGDECDYEAGERIERRYIGRSGHTKQRYDMLVKNIEEFLETHVENPPKGDRAPFLLCGGDWIPDPDGDGEI